MPRVLLIIAISLVVGFAAASWISAPEPSTGPASSSSSYLAPLAFDDSVPMEERIAALELAVSQERQARQLLQEELIVLMDVIEMRDLPPPEIATDATAVAADTDVQSTRREQMRRRNSTEGRTERLVEAGFLPSQAEWIVQREAELQMVALQERYDAGMSGSPRDYYRSSVSAANALREELGDPDYEKYLVANGRSTNIAVSNVIENSPAQIAGIRPGDQIVSYDGKRVFSVYDMTQQTLQGAPGQNVVVDIVRDGTPMQVVLPRGPLGISGGRR